MFHRIGIVLAAFLALIASPAATDAATRTWVGGNDPWDTDIFNWTGIDEPDPDDDVVFNTDNSVDMAMDNEILSLTLSGDISLDTENYFLDVNGDVTLSDAGTQLRVGRNDVAGLPATSLSAYNITVGSDATFSNANFTSFIDPAAVGLFEIESGGTLYGNGTIRNGDGISTPTVVLRNDGVIRPGNVADGFIIIGDVPPERKLTLAAVDGDARLDLDGAFGSGAVDIQRNQTLDIDIQLNDAFDGTIDLAHNASLDIEDAWTFSGTMNVDNGLVPGQAFPFFIPDTPADIAYIRGGQVTVSGSTTTIDVIDPDGTLQFDAPVVANEGTIDNNGRIVFNEDATINADVDFQMNGVDAGLTVGPGATVTINDEDMDFDGSGASTNELIVEAGGLLDFNLDSFEGNDRADGYITLNSGSMDLTVSDGSWTMERRLTLNNTGGANPTVSGSAMVVGDDVRLSGPPDADVLVTGTGSSQINVPVTWNSDAEVDVEADATLAVIGFSTFNTVNGADSAQFDGPGDIYFSGGQVNEDVTLNFSGGTVGLDGGGAAVIFLSAPDFTIDADLTINAAELDTYGTSIVFPFVDSSILTVNAIAGGALHVNLDDPADHWTLNDVGIFDVNGSNILFSTFLTGSDLQMDGAMNVDGFSRSDARLTFGASGVVNFNDAAANLRLGGGSLADPNRLEGGTIGNTGELSAPDARALHGFGTISSTIDFDGPTSELLADDGTLTIDSGANLLDVGVIGTADSDGVLRVLTPWSTAVADRVLLQGGEIAGATVNNFGANGIRGQGLVSAPVRNDTVIVSDAGGTLVVNNLLNSNDWDGPGNAGQLRAAAGSTLELHDNAPFLFNGTVAASAAAVETVGFELEFDPGSTLQLNNGGVYRSTHATDLGGTIQVGGAGASELAIAGTATFESSSATTLNSNLLLNNAATRVQSGATFAGGGALINPLGTLLTLEDGADVDVLLQNEGAMALGNSPGQTAGAEFEQTASGVLEIELAGTGLSDYDRMNLSGVAQLDGELDVSLLGGFMPALNDAFTILTATNVLGSFAVEDFSAAALDPGLDWDVVYNPTSVQLLVIEANLLTADLDLDDDVDGLDFLTIQRTDPSLIGDWQEQYGTGIPAAAAAGATFAAVPEPTTLALLAVGLGCLRRRKR